MKFLTTIVALTTLAFASADPYCTFYADPYCTEQVGSVAYDVWNNGCFQNDGGYVLCTGLSVEYSLVQSPSNDDTCGCQSNCLTFGASTFGYCTPIDLTPGYTDFRINAGISCAPNNCS